MGNERIGTARKMIANGLGLEGGGYTFGAVEAQYPDKVIGGEGEPAGAG